MERYQDGVTWGQGGIRVTRELEGTGMGQRKDRMAPAQGSTGMQWAGVAPRWGGTGKG